MAKTLDKFYIKVKRENSSSSTKPDHLSYSYSCVNAFEENQLTIQKLVAKKHGQKSNISNTSFIPLNINLSKERKRPIFQPFYTHPASETEDSETHSEISTCKESNINSTESHTAKSSSDDLETDFKDIFDKSLFVQWMKNQFRQLNSLWPFLRSKEYFLPKFCNKSHTMKMEIMLNNIDEKRKFQLKKYVADLNLGLEERYSLCNESVIEIDITPIVSDTVCLQKFLMFIQNIESSKSKSLQDSSCLENVASLKQLHKHKHQNNGLIYKKDPNRNFSNNNCKKSQEKGTVQNISKLECYHPIQEFYETDKQKSCFITNKKRGRVQKCIIKGEVEIGIGNKKESLLIKDSLNQLDPNTAAFDTPYSKVKRNRLNYTIAESMRNDYSEHSTKEKDSVKVDKTIPYEPKVYEVSMDYPFSAKKNSKQGNDVINQENLPSKTSCKCLIHKEREDYQRFRNQCLFGKGDENSNNLLKHLLIKERESKEKPSFIDKTTLNTYLKDNMTEKYFDSDSQETIKTKFKNINFISHDYREKFYSTDSLETVKQSNTNQSLEKMILNKYVIENVIKPEGKENQKDYQTTKNERKHFFPKMNESGRNTAKCVTKGKKSSFETLSPGGYHIVHIEDDEKLVSAVNYSHTSSTLSCYKDLNNTYSNNYITDDKNANLVKVNACFESLDYSVKSTSKTSFTLGRSKSGTGMYKYTNKLKFDSKNLNPQSLLSKKFNPNVTAPETNKEKLLNNDVKMLQNPFSSGFECETNTRSETNSSEGNKEKSTTNNRKNFITKKNIVGRNEIFQNNNKEEDKYYSLKNKAKKLQTDIIELTELLYSMMKIKNNGVYKNDEERFNDFGKTINNLPNCENDIEKVQAKIAELTKQLYLVTEKQKLISQSVDQPTAASDQSVNNSLKSISPTSSSTSIIIRVAKVDSKKPKSSCSNQRLKKMSVKLNFLKPRRIYRSISSVCSKTIHVGNMQSTKNKSPFHSKVKEVKYLQNKNPFGECKSIPEEDCKINLQYNRNSIGMSKNTDSNYVQSNSSPVETSMLLNSLERLNSELKHQRNEINSLKNLYKQKH